LDFFDVAAILDAQKNQPRAYLEFLRSAALSAGVYVLLAGGVDPQMPHTEDEVYFVLNGRAEIDVADETRHVQPGSLIFVAAGVSHRFHSISEDLSLLVLFAPPEYSLAEGTAPPPAAGP
jgi:mannose-6-phosphate isomerase-like protein (cupin superfamily)